MNFLAHKNFSLLCCVLNVYFAAQAYQASSWFMFLLCTGFAILCGHNYLQASKNIWDD